MSPADALGEFENIFGTIASPKRPEILLGNADLVCERGHGPDNDLSNVVTLGIYPTGEELRELSEKLDRQLHGAAS